MAREEPPPQKLSLPGVGREVLTTYRSHFWPLIVTAAIVFVPIALLEAVSEPLREVETNDGLAIGEALSAGLLVAALSLLGEIFYSGVVAGLVTAWRGGGAPLTLGEVARRLPYLRLLAVDALFALMVIGGLLIFIVPGVIVIARFVLAGPIVEIEHVGVRAAFRRSRDISRGSGLRILALMIPLLLIGDALAEAVAASGLWILGDDTLGHALSVALSEIATAPFFGLAAVVTAHHLMEFRPRSSPSPSLPSHQPAP